MFVLALCLVPYAAVWQLVVSVAPLAVGSVTRNAALAGLALAVTTLGTALATVPGGRLMDARGRRVGISAGFALAATGIIVAFAALRADAAAPLFLGLFVFGAGSGVIALTRIAAADMQQPERRARAVWGSSSANPGCERPCSERSRRTSRCRRPCRR